jgi:hypothetical protein
MKTGISLEQLGKELDRRAGAKRDYIANTNELELSLVGEGNPQIALNVPSHGFYGLNENAHQQIASRLKIPRTYYQRMLADSPNLLIDNVQHWFNSEPQRRMIRTLDHTARAFLSDRYKRIENETIAATALPVLLDRPDAVVMSANVTDEKLYLKVIFRDISGEVKPGDVVRPGLIITNSEVGKGALNIQAFFYRDYCTNGCVFGREDMFGFRRSHLGSVITGTDYEVFSDETIKKDDELILSQVRDVTSTASDEKFFTLMLEKLQSAAATEQMQNPKAGVEVLAKTVGLNEGETEQAFINLIEDKDYSQFGALNAVTKIANETPDYDRASELESLGGKILDLSFSQWQQIATADKVAA